MKQKENNNRSIIFQPSYINKVPPDKTRIGHFDNEIFRDFQTYAADINTL